MNFQLENNFRVEFVAPQGELMPEGALTSFFYIFYPDRSFSDYAQQCTPRMTSRIEYLIVSDNIVVLVLHFNSTKNIILLLPGFDTIL